jgi:hypothetical protein
MICRNSINWQEADIQGMFRVFDMGTAAHMQAVGRTVSGKFHKILVEMLLADANVVAQRQTSRIYCPQAHVGNHRRAMPGDSHLFFHELESMLSV